MVFLDQPVGVGFSYVDDSPGGTGRPQTTKEAAFNVVTFLRLFGETFPDIAKNPLHLAGESFGGRWVPVFGDLINQYNKLVPANDRIPLTSLIPMSAWTHPTVQIPSIYEVACHPFGQYPAVYNETVCANMSSAYQQCEVLLEACDSTSDALFCNKAGDVCEKGVLDLVISEHVNKYDRRVRCPVPGQCYPIMDEMQAWINTKDIFEDLLEITNQTSGLKNSFQFMDGITFLTLRESADMYMDSLRHTKSLLDDNAVPILYTAGEVDIIVNPKGLAAALENMRWVGRPFFKGVPYQDLPFKSTEGNPAGRFKHSGLLHYVELADAGHMSPLDQPGAALNLMRFWLSRVNKDGSDGFKLGTTEAQEVFAPEEL